MERWMLIRLLNCMRGCAEFPFLLVTFLFPCDVLLVFLLCFFTLFVPFLFFIHSSFPPIFATTAATRYYTTNARYLILRPCSR